MRKSASVLLAAMLILALALTGCSTGSKKTSVADGAKQMLTEVAALKDAITKNDAAKAKEAAGEIEEAWEAFEDSVKDQDKALYEQIEDPLGVIQAGTKDGKSLDAKLLTEQATKLEGLLGKLK